MYIIAQMLGSALASGIVYGAKPNSTDALGVNAVSITSGRRQFYHKCDALLCVCAASRWNLSHQGVSLCTVCSSVFRHDILMINCTEVKQKKICMTKLFLGFCFYCLLTVEADNTLPKDTVCKMYQFVTSSSFGFLSHSSAVSLPAKAWALSCWPPSS